MTNVSKIHKHFEHLLLPVRPLEIPTPYTLFSAVRLRENVAKFRLAGATLAPQLKVYFAVKSLYVPELVEEIVALTDGLDVQSAGELRLCPLNAQLSFFSPSLSAAALQDPRVLQVSVNSVEQYHKARRIADERDVNPTWGFRLALPRVSEGQSIDDQTKFGMSPQSIAAILREDHHDPYSVFIHHHSHCRLSDQDEALRVAEAFVEQVRTIQRITGWPIRRVNIGGGWDGGYQLCAKGRLLEDLVRAQTTFISTHLPDLEEIIVEPGRAIGEDAAVVVTTVEEVLPSQGTTFAIVDVAINLLFPTPLTRYEFAPVEGLSGETTHVTLVDGTCAPRGTIAAGWIPGRLRPGDRVIIVNTGTYTYSIASSFYTDPPPALLLDSAQGTLRMTHALGFPPIPTYIEDVNARLRQQGVRETDPYLRSETG